MSEQAKIEIYRQPEGRYGWTVRRWTVRVGDRYVSKLDFGEMLSTVVHLTIKGEIAVSDAPYGGLRTTEEHKAFWRGMGNTEEQIAELERNGDL